MTDLLERLKSALTERYRIERELGSGGMATVYLAYDQRHEREVALKILRPDLAATLGPERFLREIKIAAKLHHPHILPLYDSGEAAGFLYYVMPFEEGQSLREKLVREGELPVAEAVRLLRDVVDALAHAHEHGVVHRDVKPENVLLSGHHALVTDFGVAKAVSEATGRQQLTTAGVALGTPAYMAPEQAAADSHIDHRADIYAVGTLAYELLAGRPPFTGTTPQMVLSAHVTETPEPITRHREAVPPALAHLVMKCLEKKPADRWQSADELLPQLEALATPSGGITPTDTRPVVAVVKRTRRPWALAIAGVAVLATSAVVALLASRDAQVPSIGQTRQLTRAEGLEVDPAVSPDGDMIAYAAGPLNQMRLFVRHVAGGRTIALTEDMSGHHRRPQWSPDGSQIAFSAGLAIYVVPALGGIPRSLVALDSSERATSATWSADGQHVAYVRGTRFGPEQGVYVQQVSGGASQRLTDSFNAHSLSWSPDGSWIAYVSGNWRFVYGSSDFGNIATSSIWLVSSGGGSPIPVTDDASLNMSPVWMPDSRHLLFVSDRGGARDIYAVPVTRSGTLSGSPTRLTTGANAHGISLSADGTQAAYSAFTHTANIWSIKIPTRPPVSAAEATPVTAGSQVVEDLEISPDGKWLAFDSDLSGNQDIYRMPVTGGEPQQLTTHPSGEFNASWSPDGHEIAFHSLRSGTRGIYVVSADGGPDSLVIDTDAHETVPDWSPDGRHLVYGRWGEQTHLYLISREGIGAQWGEPRQLTAQGEGGTMGQWSPDGSHIAYQRANEIWLIAPTSRSSRRLVENPNPQPESALHFGYPIWSLDGRSVYFRALDSQGHPGIWSVPVVGGTPTLLVRFDDPSRQSLRLDFTTDGERFYFTITSRESDIWVMDLKW